MRTAAPASAAVTLAEARDFTRVSGPGDDALLSLLIASACAQVEAHTGRALIRQSFRETRRRFDDPRRLSEDGASFALLRPPLLSVDAVVVVEAGGATALWPDDEYRVDVEADPGRLIALAPFGFPAPAGPGGSIRIDYQAGYGDGPDAAPEPLREAVLRLVAAAFERGERDTGREPPEDVARLLHPFRAVLP